MGLASLILRQSGHYIFEPPCAEKEQAMLGFDTISKVKICIVYFVLPTLFLIQLTQIESVNAFITEHDIQVADLWILATFAIVGGRVVVLWNRYGFIVSQHWFIKFITDPFTDIPAYYRSAYQILNPKLRAYALHRSFPSKVGIFFRIFFEGVRSLKTDVLKQTKLVCHAHWYDRS